MASPTETCAANGLGLLLWKNNKKTLPVDAMETSPIFLFSRCLYDCAGRSRLFVLRRGVWKPRSGSRARCSSFSWTAVPSNLAQLHCKVTAILWRTRRTWQPRPWLKRTQRRPMELPPPPLRICATQAGMNRSFDNILSQPDRYRDYPIRIRVPRFSSITRYVCIFILHWIIVRQIEERRAATHFGGCKVH